MTIKKSVLLKVGSTVVKHIPEECPDYSYLKQDEFKDRLDAFKHGDFYFIGIKVCTEILTSVDNGKTWLINTLSSGGLWGIESDSGDKYFKEIAEEEKSQLNQILTSMGFKTDEILASFKVAEETGAYR